MHEYTAHVTWTRGRQPFLDSRYSRAHTIDFDGGVQLRGSSSPFVVKAPLSDPNAVDPEEMFVASLSSCHMLWFLSMAAERQWIVDSYSDHAIGVMGRDAAGRTVMSAVTLRPDVRFGGERVPEQSDVTDVHHLAHEACFIANSVRTEVRCEPVFV